MSKFLSFHMVIYRMIYIFFAFYPFQICRDILFYLFSKIMLFLYIRFLNPLYYGDFPLVMKENTGSKLPKFSRNQSEQLINSMDFLGINYYTIMHVKDQPHDAPSNERDFMADVSAKAICECHMCCILVSQSLFKVFLFCFENGLYKSRRIVMVTIKHQLFQNVCRSREMHNTTRLNSTAISS